jgi:hypothetical protein
MSDDFTPSEEFRARLSSATKWRDLVRPEIEAVYRFCAPGRQDEFHAGPNPMQDKPPETFISLGEEAATDLAGDLVTYFTPAEAKWASYMVTVPVDEDQAPAVLDLVSSREKDLMDLLRGSNYADVAPQIMFEATTHGTPAMWVTQGHISQPIHVETVPPAQLLITPGHMGILDRFRQFNTPAFSLPAIFEGWEVDLSDATLQRKIRKPGTFCMVTWGFWLDWSDPGNPLWRCEITVDNKRVTPKQPLTLGPMAGSCPLLVGRFNPQPGRPWGRGPGRKALPDMRELDKIVETMLIGLDQSILNTIIYPDDGFLDLSEGLEAGRAYPASRGFTRDQIYEMHRQVNLDTSVAYSERIEHRIRAAFYQDGPRQRGDTPPTASQWLDERRRVQQRLGKPSAPLWTELFYPFIQRVEHLAVESGRMDAAITHQGDVISVQPISPLQKAQNQDQVMIARSNLELGMGVFQEQLGEVVDVVATLQNIVRASGDELTIVGKQEPQNEPPPPPQ